MAVAQDEDLLDTFRKSRRIYVHGAPCTPSSLLDVIASMAGDSFCPDIYHIEISPSQDYLNAVQEHRIRDHSLFVGQNMRNAVESGGTEYMPVFLSEIPWMVRNVIRPDLTIVGLSTADSQGYHSLGPNVLEMRAAMETSGAVVGEINSGIPRTFGSNLVRRSDLIFTVENDSGIPEYPRKNADKVDREIGEKVSELVENGATIQAGIGNVSDCAMESLDGHQNLGIHTELFSNGMHRLSESGAVNNSLKTIDRGRSVATFAKGSSELYRFLNDNPSVLFMDVDYTNDTSVIRKNYRMTSINTCLSMDITGQVNAESIGTRIISGVGGQMDFVRGASLSPGGKSIFAIRSRTEKGIPKIVPFLEPGSGVTTTRNHVQYVVTENGSVNLHGLSIRERAKALISIAHPDDRDPLEKFAREHIPSFC